MSDEIQTTEEVTEEVVTPEVTETETPQIPSEEVETPVVETTEPSLDPVEPEQPDYKQKFVDSAKESILNAERVKVRDAQLEQLTKTDTPTDEAMRLVYPEWDDLNEVTKKALIKTEAQEMRQRNLEARQEEILNRFKLDEELNSVIDSNPKLLGKESEFKKFAANPKNKGISAEVLAKAFLFDVEVPTAPAPKTEALPAGSGGPRGDLKPKKISIEEAAEIRKTDSKRYMELVKTGMIDDEI
jgi:hypothetical protein